jgi:hypothetical protein
MSNRIFLALFLSLTFLGCIENEKTCTAPALEENIVGSWSATMLSGSDGLNTVAFNKDKSFKESSGLFFGNYDSTEISWKVKGDSLTLVGVYNKSGPAIYGFTLITNTCNEITLNMEGLDTLKLVRR